MSDSGSIAPLDVRDVAVLEAAHDMGDRVAFADVGEELVAQPLALRGAAHQAGDVDEVEAGRDDLLRAGDRGQRRQPGVGHGDDADVRLDGAERIVGRLRRGGLRQRVEERRLADVGQADDAAFEAHGGALGSGSGSSSGPMRGGGEKGKRRGATPLRSLQRRLGLGVAAAGSFGLHPIPPISNRRRQPNGSAGALNRILASTCFTRRAAVISAYVEKAPCRRCASRRLEACCAESGKGWRLGREWTGTSGPVAAISNRIMIRSRRLVGRCEFFRPVV